MLATTPEFGAARIIVIGDVMLDRYWSGQASRISPEAPVPVVKVKTRRRPYRGGRQCRSSYRQIRRRSCFAGRCRR